MKIKKLIDTEIPDLYCAELEFFSDERGDFLKLMQQSYLPSQFKNFTPKEVYFSTSKNNVLRGMHFQRTPHQHGKFVHCMSGSALDVVVDLRSGAGFGKAVSFELDYKHPKILMIPAGCAHGFLTRESNTRLLYMQDSEYNPSADDGVLWSSIKFDWPVKENPIMSERDKSFKSIDQLGKIF